MLKMILDILATLVLYLTPGYLLLEWVDFPALRGINRWLLALCLSLVIVPIALISVGNLVHIQASLWAWLVLVVLLATGAWLLRRKNKRVRVNFNHETGSGETGIATTNRWEKWGVVIFLVLFAAVVNLPRLLMFFQGGNVMELGPYDESWHIQQLVSVARTGIPPYDYFFPSLHLAYYYGSWVYPAILGNLPVLEVSLMRAMSIHAYLQIFAFLGLVYLILQVNIRRSWVRLAGMAFFTVMGGFDLFAKLPGVDNIEFWIREPSWLMNGNLTMQISQFATLYIWVPHHLAGGMVVLLLILVYKNLELPMWLKLSATGVLLGFCITTSPFVFMGLAIAAGLLFLWYSPNLWRERKVMLPRLLIALVLFLFIAWSPLRIYSMHSSALMSNPFQVNLVERFRGDSSLNATIDKSLTILGLPLVAGAMLLIDMGLMFILYVIWWIKNLVSGKPFFRSPQNLVLGLQPLISLLFVFMVTDTGGGSNVTMRGMIAAQILIAMAAVLALDWLAGYIENAGSKRWGFAYLFVIILIAQSISPLAELRTTSKKVIQVAMWSNCGVPAAVLGTFDPNYCLGDDAWRYVHWLNTSTPPDALVLESGPYGEDYIKFRWLERARLLTPAESQVMELGYFDKDFILPNEWAQLLKQGNGEMSALEWYKTHDFPGKGKHSVYLVTRQASQVPAGAGDPVYQDTFVSIYFLPEGLLTR